MEKVAARERIEKLRKLIDQYRYEYHVLDRLSISEDALDSLKKELFDLEQEHPELITPDSPTQRVAGKPLEGFTKVEHPGRMISLNDAFSEADLRAWRERLENFLGAPYRGGFYCDLKMDGLAIELRYERGVLVQASTRGDGMVGEDVTQNIRTVEAVPLRLRDTERNIPETLLVRGEAFLMKSEFARINAELAENGEKTYANPRNLAAGTIRQLDPSVTAGRKLSFYGYSVVATDGAYGGDFATHADEYAALRAWGVPVNPHGIVADDLDGVLAFYRAWEEKRDALDYEFDGTVISVNDNEIYRRAGIVGKSPRGAIAFKFAPRQAETVVEDIQVQVGRTGVLTPVAHLRPVHIGGTTVSRATLHNLDEVRRLDVRIGDTVIVGRAGDVIPDILKSLPELRPAGAKEFSMPKKCPVCGAAIVQQNEQVAFVCPNTECPAKQRRSMYHFASRNALNIEGLGPQTLDQLLDAGLITDAADLFVLTPEDLLNLEGFADVSSAKLVGSIRSRKKVPLSRFVYALGIEHVGEETARALAHHFHTLSALAGASEGELVAVPDIGPVVARSIAEWFARPYNKQLLKKFDAAGVQVLAEKGAAKGKLSGKTFVVTGTLDSMSREEAEEKIRALGGKAVSSVSKATTAVIVGTNPGSAKIAAAQKYGTEQLTEQEFLVLVRRIP
ncbi:MAG: NAD-dependent DNA ligase LigA [Candidatus Yanofskybacteria bacterium]|nr:NAD-dependent DNA ligase LigA [Candidatus Yanofskybacteria bacterium]